VNAQAALSSSIKHQLMALFFGLALILPSLIQLEHILDGHSHLGCTQNTTHLHELDHGCDLLAFHLSAATWQFTQPTLVQNHGVFSADNFWVNSLSTHQTPNNQASRAPPALI
jgi:hypothetical protein